jgi:hypothetical protein
MSRAQSNYFPNRLQKGHFGTGKNLSEVLKAGSTGSTGPSAADDDLPRDIESGNGGNGGNGGVEESKDKKDAPATFTGFINPRVATMMQARRISMKKDM